MMKRVLGAVAVAAGLCSCATFGSLTPGSNSDKGVWLAKTSTFLGIQFASQEVLYCTTASGTPQCTRAAGDVQAATKVAGQN